MINYPSNYKNYTQHLKSVTISLVVAGYLTCFPVPWLTSSSSFGLDHAQSPFWAVLGGCDGIGPYFPQKFSHVAKCIQ